MLIEQSNLIKYFPFLKKSKIKKFQKNYCKKNIESSCSLEIGRDNIVKIKESHCLDCGTRLVKNGRNKRLIIRDYGKGKLHLRIQ